MIGSTLIVTKIEQNWSF